MTISGRSIQDEEVPFIVWIMTLNEEQNIADAIESAKQLTPHVIVVDSYSSDATCAIAKRKGAIVWQHPYDSQCSQGNWALDHIEEEFASTWVFNLDADERITCELVSEIRTKILNRSPEKDIYLVRIGLVFDGRLLRHGGFSRTLIPRIYRISAGRFEQRPVNAHLSPAKGTTVGTLNSPILHTDVSSWFAYIEKHNRYTSLEAEARIHASLRGNRTTILQAIKYPFLRRRWIRESIWNRMPGKPLLRFIQLYVLMGGFLDGRAGFRMAMFNTWNEMCIDMKHQEMVESSRGTP